VGQISRELGISEQTYYRWSKEFGGLKVDQARHLKELENESRLIVVEHLRAPRTRVVVRHWQVGHHRDHRIASEIVRDACFLSALQKLDVPGDPFRPTKLIHATAFREDAPP
jgi:LmbE family N-acetylglucosaminyl deacetylase